MVHRKNRDLELANTEARRLFELVRDSGRIPEHSSLLHDINRWLGPPRAAAPVVTLVRRAPEDG